MTEHCTPEETIIKSLLFHIGDEPEWAAKMLAEFEELSGVINATTLKQMPIITAFIKVTHFYIIQTDSFKKQEVLRVNTIIDITIPRVVTCDVRLPDGNIMPKGTQWMVDIHRMSQVLFEFTCPKMK